MTLLKRPVSLALVLAVSVLGGLMLERGGGSDVGGELAARSRMFSVPVQTNDSAIPLADSAAALRASIGSGTAQSHVPPFVQTRVCNILATAGANVVAIFDRLEDSFPGQAPVLAAARQAALGAINAQLLAFHCQISFG